MDSKFIPNQKEKELIFDIIDKAMETGDRYVTIYMGEYGISVSVYPMEEESEEK